MALSVDTCNDIEKYEESVVAGLNAKKTAYTAVAILVGGVFGLLVYYFFHLPMILCVYAATPATGIVIMLGFYERDGMTLLQLMKNKKRKNQNKPICFVSTETKAEYEKRQKDIAVQTAEDADAEFEKIKKMVIYGAIGAVGLIVLVIVLLVVLL
jgi:hypothetical protein